MQQEQPKRTYVVMTTDYETESCNLGWRRFKEGKAYQLDSEQIEEIVAAGAGDKVEATWMQTTAPERRQEAIIPNVTRWISASGHDTHQLVKGQKTEVPSNLATYLKLNGLAEAA